MNVSPLVTAARQLADIHFWGDAYDESHGPSVQPPTAYTTSEPTSYPTESHDYDDAGSATTKTPWLTRESTSWGYNESYNSTNPEADNITNVSGWYTGLFILIFFALICFSYLLRVACGKYFGCGQMDPAGRVRHSQHRLTLGIPVRRAPSAQALRAQGLAATQEFREEQVEKQRMERRLWYTFYLKAYTTVC